MAQSQPSPAPVRPARRKKRSTARDMFLSLAVILVPLLLVTWIFSNRLPDYPVQPVDAAPVVERARAEAPYPVYVPENLPTGEGGWTVTQASWVARGDADRSGQNASLTNEWLWGGLDQERTYYAVNESDGQPKDLIDKVSRNGSRDGTSTVGGKQWQRWVSPDDRTHALVREEDGYTLTVAGDAPYEALEALASTLSAG